jgi:SAM-dependent methyltransferase
VSRERVELRTRSFGCFVRNSVNETQAQGVGRTVEARAEQDLFLVTPRNAPTLASRLVDYARPFGPTRRMLGAMTPPAPPPEALQVMRLLDGARIQFALVTALELRLFQHLAKGPASAGELAARARVSERGAQALLDAFVAIELVKLEAGRYRNGKAAEMMLVPESPMYVGDEHAPLLKRTVQWHAKMADTVRSGRPAVAIDDPLVLEFWTYLTPMIARMNRPVASQAVRELALETGSPSLLDVGGGMAVYSLALLSSNARAKATQADWPHINTAARAAVEAAGFGDRFATLDGDFRKLDFGEARFDVAVLSNIMHQESPASNAELLARLHRAVRPGGHLVVAEFVVEDGRTGPAMPLLFNLNMMTMTENGKSYERRELEALVTKAGFAAPQFAVAGPVATLVYAPRP